MNNGLKSIIRVWRFHYLRSTSSLINVDAADSIRYIIQFLNDVHFNADLAPTYIIRSIYMSLHLRCRIFTSSEGTYQLRLCMYMTMSTYLHTRARAIIIRDTIALSIWGQRPFILISANLINDSTVLFNYTSLSRYSMQSSVASWLPRNHRDSWIKRSVRVGKTRVERAFDDVSFFCSLSVPAPEHKKPTDYVSGLFRVETTLQPRPRRRLSLEESTPFCNEDADMDKK